ncbi:MAG: 7,8-didemethyl-8-hydroxy-5-deazariboflavin synthase, partial [Actinomycetota bacterium]|nr:7,8-didemethyl-8-hydroxy-5-deazariboflavin synthase [Actinomycetota bacterium]
DGSIDNIQSSWVKIGFDGVRQLLQAGVNDLGGTLMDENISRAAGAKHGQQVTQGDLDALVRPLGRTLRQRTTLYGPVNPGYRLDVARPDDGRVRIPIVAN